MAKMGRPATGLVSVMIRLLPKLLAEIDRIVKIKKKTDPELNRSKYIRDGMEKFVKDDKKDLGIK